MKLRRARVLDTANAVNAPCTPLLYFDAAMNSDAARLLPAEYFATDRKLVLVTVLGSCVAACLRDPILGVGGMNHFMLPESGNDANSPVSASMRYGTYAMEILINDLLKAGAKRENLEAKVFGGGNVLSGFLAINIGEKNAEFVRRYLQTENIKIVAEDLNDVHPRKVYFFPRTGKVFVRKLNQLNNNTLVNRDQDYAHRLQKTKVGGDIELFS